MAPASHPSVRLADPKGLRRFLDRILSPPEGPADEAAVGASLASAVDELGPTFGVRAIGWYTEDGAVYVRQRAVGRRRGFRTASRRGRRRAPRTSAATRPRLPRHVRPGGACGPRTAGSGSERGPPLRQSPPSVARPRRPDARGRRVRGGVRPRDDRVRRVRARPPGAMATLPRARRRDPARPAPDVAAGGPRPRHRRPGRSRRRTSAAICSTSSRSARARSASRSATRAVMASRPLSWHGTSSSDSASGSTAACASPGC